MKVYADSGLPDANLAGAGGCYSYILDPQYFRAAMFAQQDGLGHSGSPFRRGDALGLRKA